MITNPKTIFTRKSDCDKSRLEVNLKGGNQRLDCFTVFEINKDTQIKYTHERCCVSRKQGKCSGDLIPNQKFEVEIDGKCFRLFKDSNLLTEVTNENEVNNVEFWECKLNC